jgi:CHAT domain-containing protein
MQRHACLAIVWLWSGSIASSPFVACAQTPALVAPPRTISDITAILDREKPDPTKSARVRSEAEAQPPVTQDRRTLAQFHFRRAQALASLNRNHEAIADAEKAIQFGGDFLSEVSMYHEFLSNVYGAMGDFMRQIEINKMLSRKFDELRQSGRNFSVNLRIVTNYLSLGEISQAEIYAEKNEALLNEFKARPDAALYGSFREGYTQSTRAHVLEARGNFREAEAAFQKSEILIRDAIVKAASWPKPPLKGGFEGQADFVTAAAGRMKARQGRLAEAEADVRRALLSRLQQVGKYHGSTAYTSTVLADLLAEQRRVAEAEQLNRSAVDIHRALGTPLETPAHAFALSQLARSLYSQGKYDEAGELYSQLDVATKNWTPAARDRIRLSLGRIFTSYYTRKVDLGIELAQAAVSRAKTGRGETHFDFAMANAVLGVGLVFARRDEEALQVYRSALPILLEAARDSEDDTTSATAHDARMQQVVGPYLSLLARTPDPFGGNAIESFQLGEFIRGRSVQKALAASSARLVAGNAVLTDLVRQEQDSEKAIGAQVGALNNMLERPAGERDEKAVARARNEIEKLKVRRAAMRGDIERRFPDYANLVTPRPATVQDIRSALKPGEAFLSMWIGARSSYVWAVQREGSVAFAALPVGSADLDKKIQKLREALEPQAAMISDIPPFDLNLAHELYLQLLKPVEAGWKSAKNLIVVTNGALGLLPLGLLPTEPPGPLADGNLLFDGYRKVAWLSRTHAVTMVPSAAALRTLRGLKPGSPQRELMVGFGDPYFSAEQASKAGEPAANQVASSRGVPLARRNTPQTFGVDKAELALLPRLPDTADELKSIALALQADPAKVLKLGTEANEKTVKSMDLSKYKLVVFATHGLVPGELTGLTQPALAMTAPDVAQHDGDGLLTMEEILGLKLDADWVVLSACNTGAGAGAGAEAASGLGRAFFYAGTRAILITNWSVHSVSARELVTDLFARQAANPNISRTEALRQASMGLLDGPGFKDTDGKAQFSYAHPLFWAPYTIMGDGG